MGDRPRDLHQTRDILSLLSYVLDNADYTQWENNDIKRVVHILEKQTSILRDKYMTEYSPKDCNPVNDLISCIAKGAINYKPVIRY